VEWTSAATVHANQLRLWFASMACVVLTALRRIGLAHTELANATCGPRPRSARPRDRDRRPHEAGGGTLKRLQIGAQVTRSVHRIKIAMASACPGAAVYRLAQIGLCLLASSSPRRPERPRLRTETTRSAPAAPAARVTAMDHCHRQLSQSKTCRAQDMLTRSGG